MARGRFITFEGGEGCGKSTQIRRLKASLEEAGLQVVVVREPGGTWLCEEIRRLIKDQDAESPCDRSELLLFLAARAQIVKNVIDPALTSGAWVLSDRFSDSTVAYQGYGRGLPLDFIRSANDFACSGLRPDLTVFLDISQEAALKRRRLRQELEGENADRFEREAEAFHSKIRHGFSQIAKDEAQRVVAVDAEGDEQAVAGRVLQVCKGRFPGVF